MSGVTAMIIRGGFVAMALLATACSGGGETAEPTVANEVTSTPTSTSTSSTSTTVTSSTAAPETELTDEEQIDQLVEDYWRTVLDVASNPPVPNLDLLLEVATPQLAQELIKPVQASAEEGLGVRAISPELPFNLGTRVTVFGESAIVMVCLRDAALSFDLETGETVEEISVISLKRMEVTLVSGDWRVRASEQIERFSAEEAQSCADSLFE